MRSDGSAHTQSDHMKRDTERAAVRSEVMRIDKLATERADKLAHERKTGQRSWPVLAQSFEVADFDLRRWMEREPEWQYYLERSSRPSRPLDYDQEVDALLAAQLDTEQTVTRASYDVQLKRMLREEFESQLLVAAQEKREEEEEKQQPWLPDPRARVSLRAPTAEVLTWRAKAKAAEADISARLGMPVRCVGCGLVRCFTGGLMQGALWTERAELDAQLAGMQAGRKERRDLAAWCTCPCQCDWQREEKIWSAPRLQLPGREHAVPPSRCRCSLSDASYFFSSRFRGPCAPSSLFAGAPRRHLRSSIRIFDDETGCWQWTHGLTRDESIRLVVYKDSCGQSWAVHELGLGAQLLRNAQAVQTRINSLEDGALPPKTRLVWRPWACECNLREQTLARGSYVCACPYASEGELRGCSRVPAAEACVMRLLAVLDTAPHHLSLARGWPTRPWGGW